MAKNSGFPWSYIGGFATAVTVVVTGLFFVFRANAGQMRANARVDRVETFMVWMAKSQYKIEKKMGLTPDDLPFDAIKDSDSE